ncbi:ribose 5-phosphate isomerase B [Candidatus Bipolaricaulota bacterium]|nr:ribose 5-phosphate isomerase B [Candidatus Bipolaricaulota bacterium]
MKVAIGADHAGFSLKQVLISQGLAGHEVVDVGTHGEGSTDYPVYAFKVASLVAAGEVDMGVLVCGTGIGMAMAASRVKGVRAAVCTSEYMARMARAHNDANVLCLGGRVLGPGQALEILKVFLNTGFEGGRHAARVRMIEEGRDG